MNTYITFQKKIKYTWLLILIWRLKKRNSKENLYEIQ